MLQQLIVNKESELPENAEFAQSIKVLDTPASMQHESIETSEKEIPPSELIFAKLFQILYSNNQYRNLNVLHELVNVQDWMDKYHRQELRFICYIQKTVEKLDSNIIPILLDPMFDTLERLYFSTDAMLSYLKKGSSQIPTCPFSSLMEWIEMKMQFYLGIVNEIMQTDQIPGKYLDVLKNIDIVKSQIVIPLSGDNISSFYEQNVTKENEQAKETQS